MGLTTLSATMWLTGFIALGFYIWLHTKAGKKWLDNL
jgi:hypothetical protein